MNVPIYDLRKPEDLNTALRDLRGFWKFWSACLLSSCGLPTLRGIIITRPYLEMRDDIIRFLNEVGSESALIRHDKRLEAPPHPRGGFLVGKDLIEEAIGFFFKLERIVAVYEPADPLLNTYNINLMFESDREVWIDVVGPGFDASDLQRGDLSPHESFSVALSPEGVVSDLKLVRRVDQGTYNESLASRKEKIKSKLESSPTPGLALRIRAELGFPEDLEAHLRLIQSPLCDPGGYAP